MLLLELGVLLRLHAPQLVLGLLLVLELGGDIDQHLEVGETFTTLIAGGMLDSLFHQVNRAFHDSDRAMLWVTMGEPEEPFEDQVDALDYVAVLFELGEESGRCSELTPIEKVIVSIIDNFYLLSKFEFFLIVW